MHHLKKQEFDHGATRAWAAELSDADVMVFMTQDALPADKSLIENLVKALTEDEKTGAAYARQLPNENCSFVEKYTRSFNYPDRSAVKTKDDLPVSKHFSALTYVLLTKGISIRNLVAL